MSRIVLLVLIVFCACHTAACGGENNAPKKVENMPFSGSPDRSNVDFAHTGEARAAIGTLQSALKGALLMKFEGNVDKMANAVSGALTSAKLQQLGIDSLDSNHYKTGEYSLTHLGGGKFKVTVAPGTPKEVNQEISAK